MRKILLASVAALPLLSIGVLPASAQQLKEKGGGASQSGGLSQSPGAGGAKEKSSAQGTVGQGRSSGSEDRAAKSSAAPDRTEGRAPSGGREDRLGQSEKGRTGADQANDMKSKAQEQGKADQAQGNVKNEGKSADQIKGKSQDQAKSKSTASSTDQAKSKGKNPGQTTGSAGNQGQNQNQASGSAKNQARDNQNQNKAQQAKGQKQTPTTSGQSTRTNQQNEQNNTNARNEQGGRNEQGSVPNQGSQGSVTLNDQQRTRINETILSRRDVPRVDRVNFDIDVGRPVPREVRIREVPRELVEIHPEWRGHEFFVVRDEIIIVDRGRRIVARVPVGSSTTGERHTTTTTTTVEDLSPADIREIQQVLVEKGFYHGSVDGRLTPQFHDALITFQRREGIEATGRIDERTSASLGVSMHTEGRAGDREGGNANRAGGAQGGRDVNDQKSGQNNPAAGNERPSTSGQGNAQQAPGSRDDRNKNSESKPSGQTQQRPSTSGQAGPGNAQQSKPTQERPSTSGQGPSTSGQSQRNENQPAGPGGKGGAADTQRKRPQ
jgi:hypothetical protein